MVWLVYGSWYAVVAKLLFYCLVVILLFSTFAFMEFFGHYYIQIRCAVKSLGNLQVIGFWTRGENVEYSIKTVYCTVFPEWHKDNVTHWKAKPSLHHCYITPCLLWKTISKGLHFLRMKCWLCGRADCNSLFRCISVPSLCCTLPHWYAITVQFSESWL